MVHCYGLHRWAWQHVLASVAKGFWITCCSTVRATLLSGGRRTSLDGKWTMENKSAGRHELFVPGPLKCYSCWSPSELMMWQNGFSNTMAIELPLTAGQWNRWSSMAARQCKRRMSMGQILINDESIACWFEFSGQVRYGLCNHILFANPFSKCRMWELLFLCW